MKIGCVVMAAGKSSRFGSNKLLADLGGVPLLCRTLEHLPFQRLDRVVTVASSAQVAALCQGWPVSVVLYPGGPQSETIRRGIEAMDDMDGCVFMPGDQPLCRPDSFVRLLDAFSEQPSRAFRLSYAGQGASPVIFPHRLFPALGQLQEEQGGMAALRSQGETAGLIQAEYPWELWDADTPQALEKIAAAFAEFF